MESKDYSSISPSAKALLLSKGLTDIPFAKEAATLISRPHPYDLTPDQLDLIRAMRVVHFELRYKSIDQLLQDVDVSNILELSSGFSFRGLATVQSKPVHYIDTDLPDLIATKQQMAEELQHNLTPKGKLDILPLNALDESAFEDVVQKFSAGELAIVNEGLMMYLEMEEKKRLCGIIRNVLEERGGCWITADVYVKMKDNYPQMKFNDDLEDFLERHKVEEKKFNSFEEAEAFFNEQGFVVDKQAEDNYMEMVSIHYVAARLTPEQLANPGKPPKIQATWRLRLKD
jgi:O-methyltransferase involved in polyketide biosynthesis